MADFPTGHYLLVYQSEYLDEAYKHFGEPIRTYTTAPEQVFYLFYHTPGSERQPAVVSVEKGFPE